MFWSFGFILFYCEFGEMVTNRFDYFHSELCQCDWYLLSIEMQQLYLMFITNTQQSVNIRGFGHLLCTRDLFKKVTDNFNTKFSVCTMHIEIYYIRKLCGFFSFRPPKRGSLISCHFAEYTCKKFMKLSLSCTKIRLTFRLGSMRNAVF